ncbi:ribose transport system substrate-binding protein [Lachnospiraceae bacterium PM6-15]|uniref:sugar ABC transporter substrate-binding protein n=1 Tax=Ohessyouella blattaphilus TaxID=2949333 RepID=UPI003E284C05
MKKCIALLLAVGLIATSVIGCSNPAAEGEDSSSKDQTVASEGEVKEDLSGMTIGYLMPDTSESFLSWLSNGVKEKFAEDGVTVDIADAAGDSAKQIGQIENFAASKTDLIIVMAVDPTSVGDAITRAQAQGTKVLVAGSDTGVYDASMMTDQYDDGCQMAEMAVAWIDEVYPDAKAGTIEVALLESRDTPEASLRCDGMNTITDLSDKVKIVQTVGGIKDNASAQSAMENIMQVNPDIKVVLCYNSGGGMGVNEFVMRAGSGVSDPSKFAVFASDTDEASLALVADSADDKAVLRGIVKFGSDDLIGDTYNLAKKMISGAEYEVMNPDPLTKVTPENVADFQ